MGWKRWLGWVLVVVFGVALIGLGVYLFAAGLDRADKLGSAIGVLPAVAGFGVSIYGIVLARRGLSENGGQTITDSFVGQNVVRTASRPGRGPQSVTRSTVLGSVADLDSDSDSDR